MLKFTDNYRIDAKPADFSSKDRPFFHDLNAGVDHLAKEAEQHRKYDKVLLIGNGGAVNSFLVLHHALYTGKKPVKVLNSMEPDLIDKVKKEFAREDTLVVTSSTSGTNVGALEIMSQFLDYEMVVITAKNNGALLQIAQKTGKKVLHVPHITDRFLTSGALAYFPLAVLGLDIARIDKALHEAYKKFAPDKENTALRLSQDLFELEKQGYTEVFVPIYSHALEPFAVYIMQLMHESVCKSEKGQTFLVVAAPESQHHTNQRFFGGHKNIAGLFIAAGQRDQEAGTGFPDSVADVPLRDGTIADINGVGLYKAFSFESQGTMLDAQNNSIPTGLIELDAIDEDNVAEMVAFWHYVAVYSSWLRGVNPFDQPQVEKSKEIAFNMRKDAEK